MRRETIRIIMSAVKSPGPLKYSVVAVCTVLVVIGSSQEYRVQSDVQELCRVIVLVDFFSLAGSGVVILAGVGPGAEPRTVNVVSVDELSEMDSYAMTESLVRHMNVGHESLEEENFLA